MEFENQRMLEDFFNRHQTPKLLRKELQGSQVVLDTIARSELPEDFCLALLSHLILAKRAPVSALVGVLVRFNEDSSQPYQKTADMLLQAVKADLADYDPARDQVIVRFDLDPATHELIRQYQYLPPMIVPPLTVGLDSSGNRGSGYITVTNDSLILKDNHHVGDICPDSLNRFNQIPLQLNVEVATQVKNTWSNLDRPKPDETYQDYADRLKAFARYQKDTAFTMALMVETGNRFHLTHKVDKRGRTYCQGYHISYQGNDWSKACLEFAEEELVLDEAA